MAELGQTVFVVRRNVFEASLDMYPYKEWEALVSGVQAKLNLFNPRHAAFMRELYRGVQEVEMDASGRVLLSKKILEEVGIDKELVLAGQDSKIGVWEPQHYEAVRVDGEDFARLTQEVFDEQNK